MFKDRLKSARKSKGFTQEFVANEIGVKKSTFSGYESGNSEPDMEKLIKIMKLLEIDANYLYQDEMSNSAPNFSREATELAYAFDQLSPAGKELIRSNMEFASKYHPARKALPDDLPPGVKRVGMFSMSSVPVIQGAHDSAIAAKNLAKREAREMQQEQETEINK